MDEKRRKVRNAADLRSPKHRRSCRPSTESGEHQNEQKERLPEFMPEDLEAPHPAMYAYRWPDGTVSLVWAESVMDALLQLDEFGPAEPEFVLPLSSCLLDFALADDGTLQLLTIGEETSDELFEHCYPQVVHAKEVFPPNPRKIKDAVAFERTRLERSGVTPAKSAQGRFVQDQMLMSGAVADLYAREALRRLSSGTSPSADPHRNQGADILQIRATIREIDPPIWRTLQIHGDARLSDLHLTLQGLFFWWNYHLHDFWIDGVRYSEPDPEDLAHDRVVEDERLVPLNRVLVQPGTRFQYNYDFGDNWWLDLELEQVLAPEPRVRYPRCIAGERNAPPEDVGGVSGFAKYIGIMADRYDPEYREMRRWRGPFKPDKFSLAAVNRNLLHGKHIPGLDDDTAGLT
jgi:hypothetical protein